MLQEPQNDPRTFWIIGILCTIVASVSTAMWIRYANKSEESASKEYVDSKNDKLKDHIDNAVLKFNEELKKKVDKDDYKEDIAEVKVMLNTLINLHIKP